MAWPCKHADRIDELAIGFDESKQQPTYRCGECQTVGVRTADWTWFGSIECRKCHGPSVERVVCPACSKGKDIDRTLERVRR